MKKDNENPTAEETKTHMRRGSLIALAQELEQLESAKYDVVAEPEAMQYVGGNLVINTGEPVERESKELDISSVIPNGVTLPQVESKVYEHSITLAPTPTFNRQIASRLDIDARYMRRLMDESDPRLIDYNVNWWLERADKNYMIRGYHGSGMQQARAFLSSSYQLIDNYDSLFAALEAIKATGADVTVESCDLSEKRMYVRVYCKEVFALAPDLLKGYVGIHGRGSEKPVVWAGFVIENSEIGGGKFKITPRIVIQVCINGMKRNIDALGKTHLGKRLEPGRVKWSQETIKINNELIAAQTKDAVSTFMSKDYLTSVIEEMTEKGADTIKNPVRAVDNMCTWMKTSETEKDAILSYFMTSGETIQRRRFDAVQAVTRYAQDVQSADRASTLEDQAVLALDRFDEFDTSPVVVSVN